MNVIRKIIKFFVFAIFAIVIISVAGYYYLKNTWRNFISEDELTELVTKVKIAEPLPDKFYELYEEEYPKALYSSLYERTLKNLFSNKLVKSPSLLVSTISLFSREATDSAKISNRKAYILALKIEEETTQKECLNWALQHYKFELYIHGINEVAAFYYRKSVSELNERELKDIIMLMKKPSIVKVPKQEELEQH